MPLAPWFNWQTELSKVQRTARVWTPSVHSMHKLKRKTLHKVVTVLISLLRLYRKLKNKLQQREKWAWQRNSWAALAAEDNNKLFKSGNIEKIAAWNLLKVPMNWIALLKRTFVFFWRGMICAGSHTYTYRVSIVCCKNTVRGKLWHRDTHLNPAQVFNLRSSVGFGRQGDLPFSEWQFLEWVRQPLPTIFEINGTQRVSFKISSTLCPLCRFCYFSRTDLLKSPRRNSASAPGAHSLTRMLLSGRQWMPYSL